MVLCHLRVSNIKTGREFKNLFPNSLIEVASVELARRHDGKINIELTVRIIYISRAHSKLLHQLTQPTLRFMVRYIHVTPLMTACFECWCITATEVSLSRELLVDCVRWSGWIPNLEGAILIWWNSLWITSLVVVAMWDGYLAGCVYSLKSASVSW